MFTVTIQCKGSASARELFALYLARRYSYRAITIDGSHKSVTFANVDAYECKAIADACDEYRRVTDVQNAREEDCLDDDGS